MTDVLVFSTLDPVLTETAEILGQQAGNTLDQLVRAVLIATTTIQYASSATTNDTISSAMKITKAEVQEAVRTLKQNNAKKITSQIDPSTGFNTSPVPACYIGLVHPNTTYDLKNITGFIKVEEYPAGRAVMEGEVGALDEVRFIESTNSYSVAGSLTTVYYTIILASDAYAISRVSGEAMRNIVKPLGSSGAADPLDQRQTSGWKASFVAKILNENFLLCLRHAVTS